MREHPPILRRISTDRALGYVLPVCCCSINLRYRLSRPTMPTRTRSRPSERRALPAARVPPNDTPRHRKRGGVPRREAMRWR